MHIAGVLLIVLLGSPAAAGEVLRYRAADGSLGFVDDERRLPPDAVILSRTPRTSRPATTAASTRDAAAPAEPAEAATASSAGTNGTPATAEAGDCDSYPERQDRLRCWHDRGTRCTRFGLPLRCDPKELAAAQGWCRKGTSLRSERTPIDDQLAAALEDFRACKSRSRPGSACSREELLTAEREVEVWELRLTALEEQCHEQDCLPGWVRESCEDVTTRR